MIEGYEGERRTLNALTSVLAALPQARVEISKMEHPFHGTRTIDAAVDLSIAGREMVLLVEVKRAVYPRDVRQVLWQLRDARNAYAHEHKSNVVPLVAAESISEGARELLRAENVGFFDMGGSLFVPAKGAYLYIDRPVPKTIEKSVRSLFIGKRSQVLHALLMKREEWLGVTELSHRAEVSPATASETLAALERMEWVSTRGQGPSKERRLSNASGLLNEWRTQVQASRQPLSRRRYYVPGGDLTVVTRAIAEHCERERIEYALTQEAAAQRYAPFLSSYSRVAIRIPPIGGVEALLASIDARLVIEGANVDILETRTQGEFLFREKIDQLWLASPVQVYLDLLRGEGRSRDMAEHLRKEILRI
jgi:DNA-binding transcriptional ArsR family regulator